MARDSASKQSTNTMSMTNGAHSLSFGEIDQVYHLTGQWIDPPPPPPELGKQSDIFLACNRTYPLRSPDDSYTWIELRDPGLIATVRSIFPTASSLYDRKPGVSRAHACSSKA